MIPNPKALEAEYEDKESALAQSNDYKALDAVLGNNNPPEDIDDKDSPDSEGKVDLTTL